MADGLLNYGRIVSRYVGAGAAGGTVFGALHGLVLAATIRWVLTPLGVLFGAMVGSVVGVCVGFLIGLVVAIPGTRLAPNKSMIRWLCATLSAAFVAVIEFAMFSADERYELIVVSVFSAAVAGFLMAARLPPLSD